MQLGGKRMVVAAMVAVIPLVIFSFWKVSLRDEFEPLRKSGQKINLNFDNLRAGYRRKEDDPLRETHIKLARIGFLHWALVPFGFFLINLLAVVVEILVC
ncbi:hypothetical protein [Aliiroseovarius marinus]|uniref:hypothetical protein n=1 Tax=Aliiroseovarius marinus TaxID=2500159 RepID=UPI003D7EF87D